MDETDFSYVPVSNESVSGGLSSRTIAEYKNGSDVMFGPLPDARDLEIKKLLAEIERLKSILCGKPQKNTP